MVYGVEWTGMKAYLPDSKNLYPSVEIAEPVKCNICNEMSAVCFCLECEKKLCDNDYKVSLS